MQDIIFINSHPIQYFAPLYKFMNEQGLKTKAWYCSGNSTEATYDKGFGVPVKWDIPLLDGYEYSFFKNNSFRPSHENGFFGLINFRMIAELFKIKKSIIVVHGWNYFTHLSILLLAKLKGHTVCLRCEVPQSQELIKKGWKQLVKQVGLKCIIFPSVKYFFYIGTQNRLFYKSYNIQDSRLIFCPYAVDDQRFSNDHLAIAKHIAVIKQRLGIPIDDKIILYSGKYNHQKRPLDILKAFVTLRRKNCWLIMAGEGELRCEMENFIKDNYIKQVILTGFVNQSLISEYYAISNVFVMCSSAGETWGLSVNEAMNFNLPVIVSDITGCSVDLVKDGVNGYTYKTGDTDQLALRLEQVLFERRLTWTESSQKILNKYSFSVISNNLKNALGKRVAAI